MAEARRTDIHSSVFQAVQPKCLLNLAEHGYAQAMKNTASPSVELDGVRLRELRKLQGHTLRSFAEKCEISVGYLSQLELGDRRMVSPPTFGRICDALGVEDRRDLVRTVAA